MEWGTISMIVSVVALILSLVSIAAIGGAYSDIKTAVRENVEAHECAVTCLDKATDAESRRCVNMCLARFKVSGG